MGVKLALTPHGRNTDNGYIYCVTVLLYPFFYVDGKYGPLEKKDEKRLTSAEIKFFRRTARYTLF